jgi:hypothetical protein
MKRQIFDTPFDLFKEKNVHLLESTMKKGKTLLIISKSFIINCSKIFIAFSKLYATHQNFLIF